MTQFKEFPKMARFSRECILTEKIDGTNASIFIQDLALEEDINDPSIIIIGAGFNGSTSFTLRAGSRTRWITPKQDNMGFANWVKNHPELTREEIVKEMDDILVQVKKSNDTVDYVYNYFKEKYEKSLEDK